MTHFRTVSDRFEIEDFGPEHVHILDVATGLAKSNRFNGQYDGDHSVSVAQHSVLISYVMEKELSYVVPDSSTFHLKMAMIGLLHDASEAYLGDCPKPFKVLLPDFEAVENKFQSACYIKLFGRDITKDEHDYLKVFDQRMLDMECRELKRPTVYNLVENERLSDIYLYDHKWWDIADAKSRYLARYEELSNKINRIEKEQAA